MPSFRSFLTILPLLFISSLFTSLSAWTPPSSPPSPSPTFSLTYVFTATLHFSTPPIPPIPNTLASSTIITIPVLNGTVSGPRISGTVLGGLGGGEYFLNGSVERPWIRCYGALIGGEYFVVEKEEGVSQVSTDMLGATGITRLVRTFSLFPCPFSYL
jgi:hypothetical protein